MSQKIKNNLLLIFVLILAAIMFSMVIFDAVKSNRKGEIFEIYIDNAPLDYSADSNAVYAYKFNNAMLKMLSSQDNPNIRKIVNGMLDAMSSARIPAVKLGKIADVINQSSNELINLLINNQALTDEEIEKLIATTKMQHIADFMNNFFDKTTLTEEEFSTAIYHFMRKNASTNYKVAMNKLGKEDYVTFISNTFYLINTMGDIMESQSLSINPTILQASLYELGTKYVEITDKVGLGAIKTIMGFDWIFIGNDEKTEKLNSYSLALSDKISLCFAIIGYSMRNINTDDIENLNKYFSLEEGKEKNDYLIYTQLCLSKSILKAMEQSLVFTQKDGIDNTKKLFKYLYDMIQDSYMLRITLQDEIEDAELRQKYENSFNSFTESLKYFSSKKLNLEQISNTSVEEYQVMLDYAKNSVAFKETLDDFVYSVVYVWCAHLLGGTTEE